MANTNDLGIVTKLVVYGRYEAVAEACMHIWRADGISRLRSDGIREVDVDRAPGLYAFMADCERITDTVGPFCSAVSKEFPTTMVGTSTAGWGLGEEGDEHCFWGSSAHINGVEILGGITGSQKSRLPPEIACLVDDSKGAGAFPRASIPQLHSYGLQRLQEEAMSRLSGFAAQHEARTTNGFPRWSLLTHSVNSLGLGGFEQGLPAVGKFPSAQAALVKEAELAQDASVASWVDTLFCGSRTPSSDIDDATRAPYSSKDVCIWAERRLGILQFLGNASADHAVANALTGALSSPAVAMKDGTHPLPWLVGLHCADDEARAGIERLLRAVGDHGAEYDSQHVSQALRAVSESGFSTEPLRLALAMGLSPGLVASRLLPLRSLSSPEQVSVAHGLMHGFHAIYGSYKGFPEELRRAFADSSESVAQAFEAVCTEEHMQEVITGWQATAHAQPAATVAVTVKKRRRSLV